MKVTKLYDMFYEQLHKLYENNLECYKTTNKFIRKFIKTFIKTRFYIHMYVYRLCKTVACSVVGCNCLKEIAKTSGQKLHSDNFQELLPLEGGLKG